MTVPAGTPRRTVEPDPVAALMAEFRKLSNRMDKMERSAPLRNASISGGSGLTVYDGGIIAIKDQGSLLVDGNMDINGPARITGPLELPAGIIGNDALANPITVDQSSTVEVNFAVPSTDKDFAPANVPVPDGFTRALVMVVTTAGAINTTTSPDYLYGSTVIQGQASRPVFGYAGPSGGSTAITTAKSDLLTNLDGGTINLAVRIHSGTPWAVQASNRAYVEAQIIFLR